MFTDYLDGPNLELWSKRKDWIEKLLDDKSAFGGYEVSEQACALMMDLQVVFCAGAWVSDFILTRAETTLFPDITIYLPQYFSTSSSRLLS